MKHNKSKKLLFQYCAGLVPESEREELEKHIASCSRCHSESQRIRLQLTELKDNPPFQLEDDFFAQCREDVSAAYTQSLSTPHPAPLGKRVNRKKSPGFMDWFFQPTTAIALALILAFLIYGLAVIKTERLLAFNLPFSLFQPLNPS